MTIHTPAIATAARPGFAGPIFAGPIFAGPRLAGQILAGRILAGVALLAGCLGAASPAAALCSKPLLPYCISDGTLAGGFIPEETCRRNVRKYLDDLVVYRECLASEAVEAQKEVDRLEKLLAGEDAVPPS